MIRYWDCAVVDDGERGIVKHIVGSRQKGKKQSIVAVRERDVDRQVHEN